MEEMRPEKCIYSFRKCDGRGNLEVIDICVRRIFKIDLGSLGYMWEGCTELMTRMSDRPL
jgi:hypothetical protein